MNWKTWLSHVLFNLGFWTLFWQSFEFAYKLGIPIWSGTFGPPIPHHYLIGAFLSYLGYILITFNREKIERIIRVLKNE